MGANSYEGRSPLVFLEWSISDWYCLQNILKPVDILYLQHTKKSNFSSQKRRLNETMSYKWNFGIAIFEYIYLVSENFWV